MKAQHYIKIDENIRKLATNKEIEVIAGFKDEIAKLHNHSLMIEQYISNMEKAILGRKKP